MHTYEDLQQVFYLNTYLTPALYFADQDQDKSVQNQVKSLSSGVRRLIKSAAILIPLCSFHNIFVLIPVKDFNYYTIKKSCDPSSNQDCTTENIEYSQKQEFQNLGFWCRMYYEIISNSLQGLLVSILYCFACNDVQDEMRKIISRKQLNHRMSRIGNTRRPSRLSIYRNSLASGSNFTSNRQQMDHRSQGPIHQHSGGSQQTKQTTGRRGSVSTVTTAITCSSAPASAFDGFNSLNNDIDHDHRRRGSRRGSCVSTGFPFVNNPEFLRNPVFCKCPGCGEINLRFY